MTLPFFIVGGGVLDAPLSAVLSRNKRRGVTFLSPNKKVTKEVGLKGAECRAPARQRRPFKNTPSRTWEVRKRIKPSELLPDNQEVHSVSLVLFISASIASHIKRFRLLPWLAAKSLMI